MSTLNWSGHLVKAGIAMSDVQSASRAGNPGEILAAARRLQEQAALLVAWLEEDFKRRNG